MQSILGELRSLSAVKTVSSGGYQSFDVIFPALFRSTIQWSQVEFILSIQLCPVIDNTLGYDCLAARRS